MDLNHVWANCIRDCRRLCHIGQVKVVILKISVDLAIPVATDGNSKCGLILQVPEFWVKQQLLFCCIRLQCSQTHSGYFNEEVSQYLAFSDHAMIWFHATHVWVVFHTIVGTVKGSGYLAEKLELCGLSPPALHLTAHCGCFRLLHYSPIFKTDPLSWNAENDLGDKYIGFPVITSQ